MDDFERLINSVRGSKLEKVVHSVSSRHTNVLRPVKGEAYEEEGQLVLPAFGTGPQTELGDCYERITLGLFGGVHTGSRRRAFTPEGYQEVNPDITDPQKRIYSECKTAVRGQTCNLINHQIEGYQDLQHRSRNWKIRFVFNRHSVRGIRSREFGKGVIAEEVAKSTNFSLHLPASVVFRLHDIGRGVIKESREESSEGNPLIYNYDGSTGYDPCVCIRSHVLNMIFVEPEVMISAIGLEPDNYKIKRYRSPRNFSIDGHELLPFPILIVSQKKHSDWIRRFDTSYLPRVEKRRIERLEGLARMASEEGCSDLLDEEGLFVEDGTADYNGVANSNGTFEYALAEKEDDDIPF